MDTSRQAEAHEKRAAGQKTVSYHFRYAHADDAAACAPLIFIAGTHEFRFFLGVSDEQSIAFLRFAFAARLGHFSWRRHRLGCAQDGTVLVILAAQHYRSVLLDNLYTAWMLLRFFGPVKAVGMMRRGLILEREQPGPERGQILLTNGAVNPDVPGIGGIFTMLFYEGRIAGWLPKDGKSCCLNVLRNNTRVRRLHERTGFVEQPRKRPPAANLPADLVSVRYAWQGRKRKARPAAGGGQDQAPEQAN